VIEDNLDCFGMGAMMAIGRVGHITARLADARQSDAIVTAD